MAVEVIGDFNLRLPMIGEYKAKINGYDLDGNGKVADWMEHVSHE